MNITQFGDSRLPSRFWSKVIVSDSGCWLWVGALTGAGRRRYGSFGVSTGCVATLIAMRISFSLDRSSKDSSSIICAMSRAA